MEINPARVKILTERLVSYLHRENCDANIVKQIIVSGADVNYCDRDFNSLVHMALRYCRDKFNLVHELLVAGFLLNKCNVQLQTALHFAVMYCDDIKVVQDLISHGASVHLKDLHDNLPLHLAVQNNKKSFVEALIHAESDVNSFNLKRETPLIIAVKNDNLEIVKILLSSGASTSLTDESKMSPLHWAVKSPKPNQGILIELLKHHALLFNRNDLAQSSLEFSIQKFYTDPSDKLLTVKTLLKYNNLMNYPRLEKYKLQMLSKKYDICPHLITFNRECILEKMKLKKEFIHKNFCLFDFVREGFESNPMFQKKTVYKELIFNQILYVSRKYPIYSDIIAYHLGRINLCLKSMELCVYTWKECREGKQQIFLPPDAIFLIAGFLSNEDVMNLIIAFSDPQHFTTHDFGFDNLALGKSTKRKLDE